MYTLVLTKAELEAIQSWGEVVANEEGWDEEHDDSSAMRKVEEALTASGAGGGSGTAESLNQMELPFADEDDDNEE